MLPSFASSAPTVEDRGGRLRMLKYTPEHMHCIATFYGPITPPGTGILGYQTAGGVGSSKTGAFRIRYAPLWSDGAITAFIIINFPPPQTDKTKA